MNKQKLIDAAVIVLIALFLLSLSMFGLLESSAKFMLVPILAFYFLGKYVQKKAK